MPTDAEMKPIVPMMGAEGGFEEDESVPPLRISGFLCLLFGLLSALGIIGYPMLVTAVIAIVLGLVALRPWEKQKPVGVTPARIGLVLAVAFGSCGYLVHTMKSRTLAEQAEYFARQYLEVVAKGEYAIAMELKKEPVNRLPLHMPLMDHYQSSEDSMKGLTEFESDGINQQLSDVGPGVDWELGEPVRVFQYYGMQQAELLFLNPNSNQDPKKIYMLMKYDIDSQGVGQWRVDQCRPYMKRLVAESIL